MSVKKRQRDGTWYYRFNHNRQTHQQYGFSAYKAAKDAENLRIKEIQEGKKVASFDIRTLSVRDAAQLFYDEHASKLNGWRNYQPHLVAIATFFKNRRMVDISKQDGEQFCAYVRGNIKTKTWSSDGIKEIPVTEHTVHHYFRTLKTVFNWWIKEKEANIPNPMLRVKMKTIPKARVRFLYPAEEKILTEAMRKYEKMWPYYFTALETGLREWNLAVMKVQDIDFVLGQIFIPLSKNERSGYIPISNRLRDNLHGWIRGRKPDDKALGEYTADTISHNFTEIVREAKIIDFTFHDLRHTFAYNLLRQGKPIYIVSKLLLHRNVRTTEEHYGHLAVTDLGKVVNEAEGVVSSVAPKLAPNEKSNKTNYIKSIDSQP